MFDLIKYDRRRAIKGDCRRTTIYHSTLQVSKEQQIKQNAFVLLAIKFVINRRCGLFLPIFYRIIKQDSQSFIIALYNLYTINLPFLHSCIGAPSHGFVPRPRLHHKNAKAPKYFCWIQRYRNGKTFFFVPKFLPISCCSSVYVCMYYRHRDMTMTIDVQSGFI